MTALESDFGTRELPHNIEAEMSVLGGLMLSKDVFGEVRELVGPEDFYRASHKMIYEAIVELSRRHEPFDVVTVFDELGKRGELIRCGGAAYLHTLVSTVPTATNAGYYAKIVREHSRRRTVIETATQLVERGYGYDDPEEMIAEARRTIVKLANAGVRGSELGMLADIMPDALDEIANYGKENVGTISTGFRDLDALTSGMATGQLWIVAGRPGLGKSTWAMDVARHAAKQGHIAAIFSLEMKRADLIARMLSAEARVNITKMRAGQIDEEEWQRIGQRLGDVAERPIAIDDSTGIGVEGIYAKCERLRDRYGLRLVVVDYLQLMQGVRTEGRQQEVSDISRSLKLLAMELDVTVVAASQLNRGPEMRQDKRPQVSDLRESGSIEQDADMVVLIHREEAYERETARAGEADLIVGKNRVGPTGTVTVGFQGHYSRFVDLART